MTDQKTIADTKEKLQEATNVELEAIAQSAYNLASYYKVLYDMTQSELVSRDPNKPVQLDLF